MAMSYDFDYLVVGSGFGGSVSALRLTEKGYSVGIVERGRRFRDQDFAKTNWDLRRFLWFPLLRCFGIQNMSLFKDVLVLSGSGVGGGSLVYANTLLEPDPAVFQSESLRGLASWAEELKPHYHTALRMLGAAINPKLTWIDEALRGVAVDMNRQDSFSPTRVGVYFGKQGDEGKESADPYFGGAGPSRRACHFCGGCMVGCRHNAKNTLEKNYLYFAEKGGAQILPEWTVDHLEVLPINEKYPQGGYRVHAYRTTDFLFKRRRSWAVRGLVLSAGVLGTVNLLLRSRDVLGSLPDLSPVLGSQIRTNNEALVGVTLLEGRENKRRAFVESRAKALDSGAPAVEATWDVTRGVAISSGFQADEETYVEPVRYSRGSDFMRLLATAMVDGDPAGRMAVPVRFIRAFLAFWHQPWAYLRATFTRDWAARTVILLVMQNRDNQMSFRLKRSLWNGFRRRIHSEQSPAQAVPSFIPVGHRVAKAFAEKVGGVPQSAVNEVTLQIPTTAHILGGCPLGSNASSGVVNHKHQVFGYERLLVCDGSVISCNLGVNPSLTITAMTERAMTFVPKRPQEWG